MMYIDFSDSEEECRGEDSSSDSESSSLKLDPSSPTFCRDGDDDAMPFLRQLDKDAVPLIEHDEDTLKHLKYIEEAQVAWMIWGDAPMNLYLKTCREFSDQANDFRFYHSVIEAAVALVYLLFDKWNKLWQEFGHEGNLNCSVADICKFIVRYKIDSKEYSLLTEWAVADMVSRYEKSLAAPSRFKDPYQIHFPVDEEEKEVEKDAVYRDIKKAVSRMNNIQRLKVDDHTRLLIELSKKHYVNLQEMLLARIVKMVDIEALYNMNPDFLPPSMYEEDPTPYVDLDFHLKDLLLGSVHRKKLLIRPQLNTVMRPLRALCELGFRISDDVYEIIQIAELRHRIQGDRFIGRNHFVWAFYECGYGFPVEIRHAIKLTMSGEDHPPYHIYATSIKLAKSLNEDGLQLEHFIFAVLFAKHVYLDPVEVAALKAQFKIFRNGLGVRCGQVSGPEGLVQVTS